MNDRSPRRRRVLGGLMIVTGFVASSALATLCALAVVVALWRAGLPEPSPGPVPGLAVVFFAADVETTIPRAEKALELVRAGLVDRVLLVGGARPERGFYGSPVLAETMAAREGAARARWTADRLSSDTLSNLDAVRAHLAAEPPAGPLYLVSDDYHLWRIAWFVAADSGALRESVFAPSNEPRGLSVHVERAIWEIGAWASLALPARLREWVLSLTRH